MLKYLIWPEELKKKKPAYMSKHKIEVHFTVNGKAVHLEIKPGTILLDLIREDLQLSGTKPGCHEGECGACTVLVDGVSVNSCLYPAVNIDGKSLQTIEGVSKAMQTLSPVQNVMLEKWAVQCGFCSPGMVMSIKSFYDKCQTKGIKPNRSEIKKAIEGNLCRCTGYVKVIDAVESLFEQAPESISS